MPGTVHPHGRGDNTARARETSKGDGSPPRAWGQPPLSARGPAPGRFTPTGVGTTGCIAGHRVTAAVHPHGRGDNDTFGAEPHDGTGSPPRAWGQQGLRAWHPLRMRFTPTGVGTTSAFCARACARTVHPHGRGDNGGIVELQTADLGSPPRAWGQRDRAPRQPLKRRFTPTGVGTTSRMNFQSASLSVHPHGRGDNTVVRDLLSEEDGSPPRAWGQRWDTTPRPLPRRFTPTGVGTTDWADLARSATAVHPHGRGDNLSLCLWSFCRSGSPPRAWGQPPVLPSPEQCGGSPPRAWGQRAGEHLWMSPYRFTPTGVGTTWG